MGGATYLQANAASMGGEQMHIMSELEIARMLDHVNERTFLGSLKRAAQLRGDEVVVRFTDGADHTAPALLLQSGKMAALLVSLGVKAGDRVVILCGNRAEFLWTLFAASWLGAVAAPLNVSLRGMTLRHPLDELEPVVIVCENATAEALNGCGGATNRTVLNV